MKTRLYPVIIMFMAAFCLSGCGIQLAPSEAEKQNAWLHHKTVETAAGLAREENASPPLQALTRRAIRQSEVILARTGLPLDLPAAQSTEDLLHNDNLSITETAYDDAIQRPNPWAMADQMLEISIGVAGLIGGAVGTRLLRNLRTARDKAHALREIIQGNEQFKKGNPVMTGEFKQAHQKQSQTTRRLVAEIKSS